MGEYLKIDASMVSYLGLSDSAGRGSYYMSGRYTSRGPQINTRISIDCLNKTQLYTVGENLETALPEDNTVISVTEELNRFYQKNFENTDDFEVIFEKLFNLVNETNNMLYDVRDDEDEAPDSTFAGLLVQENVAGVVSLGESRIYLIRNGMLKQLTGDKRKAERLLRMGIITDEQAEALTGKDEAPEEAMPAASRSDLIVIRPGDTFLLCSNKLLDYIDEEALLYILSLEGDSAYIASTALDEILKRQKKQDILLQVIKINEIKAQKETRQPRAAAPRSNTLRSEAASSRTETAAASAGTVSRPYRPTAASRLPSKKAGHKIKRAIRLVFSTVIIFAIVFGIFMGLQRLLFGPSDKKTGGNPTSSGGATQTTKKPTEPGDTSQPTNNPTQPNETTQPSGTTAPTTTRSQQTTSPTAASGTEVQYELYTIKRGDSLMSISRQFYGVESKYKLIQEFNNIADPNQIQAGQVIKIPK